MIMEVNVTEIPKPSEEPRLAREAAQLIIDELCDDDYSASSDVDRQVSQMEPRRTVAAIDQEGVILATGGLKRVTSKEARIVDVVTAPEHRSKGIGKRVMSLLEKLARDEGYHELEVYPLPLARRFYRELEFQSTNGPLFTKPL